MLCEKLGLHQKKNLVFHSSHDLISRDITQVVPQVTVICPLYFLYKTIGCSSFTGKDCGTYISGNGLVFEGKSTNYPASKTCLCKAGYKRKNNDKSFSVKCQTNAQWSGPNDGLPEFCSSK